MKGFFFFKKKKCLCVLYGIVAVGVSAFLHPSGDFSQESLAAFDLINDTQEKCFVSGGIPAASGLVTRGRGICGLGCNHCNLNGRMSLVDG